jgi:rod shape-determining protein MreB
MFGLTKSKRLSIDLGTANTLIYIDNELVLDEPSVVAVRDDRASLEKTVIAVGKEAKSMLGRTPGSIEAIRPMKDGVIADFTMTKIMLKHFIRKVMHSKFFSPSPTVLVCVPCSATQVERRAIKESASEAGAKEVFLIDEPIAAALGAGMDIGESAGHMVIDIGGGTTEVAVLSLNGVVYAKSLRIGGDVFNKDIMQYVWKKNKIIIGENTAERIKEDIGSAFESSTVKKKTYTGRGVSSGLPEKFVMTNQQVLEALKTPLSRIVGAVRTALAQTPPELSSDIAESGATLTGGGALLEGLDKLIKDKTNLDVHIADEPLTCVVRGGSIALDLIDKHNMSFLSSE